MGLLFKADIIFLNILRTSGLKYVVAGLLDAREVTSVREYSVHYNALYFRLKQRHTIEKRHWSQTKNQGPIS